MNYSDGIIAFLYDVATPTRGREHYLFVIDAETGKRLATITLDSTHKLFVRHNRCFLWYGTHTSHGAQGFKEWALQGYNIDPDNDEGRGPLDKKMHLEGFVGSDMANTVCFEIHNDYFYALSNQTSFEVEEVDWTSLYHCYRFPVNDPSRESLIKIDFWRRNHDEGPINDSWNDLRMYVDEKCGDLMVVESRREWIGGGSHSQRTYYMRSITAEEEKLAKKERKANKDSQGESDVSVTDIDMQSPATISTSDAEIELDVPIPQDNDAGGQPLVEQDISGSSATQLFTDPLFPRDDPILRIMHRSDKPNWQLPEDRPNSTVHPGDGAPAIAGHSGQEFILAKTKLRWYNPHAGAGTWIDLVDDPIEDFEMRQRLRIRVGSRTLQPIRTKDGILETKETTQKFKKGIEKRQKREVVDDQYTLSEVKMWPSLDTTEGLAACDALNEQADDVQAAADERSIVYMTGSDPLKRMVVFISFDKYINFGAQNRQGEAGVGESAAIVGRAAGVGSKSKGKANMKQPLLARAVDVSEYFVSGKPAGDIRKLWEEKS
jgi:hypothetical protein